MSTTTSYNCTALTGGADRALDSYAVATLVDGDRAFVSLATGQRFLYFVFVAASTAAEDVAMHPYAVRPNDYATQGVWLEGKVSSAEDCLNKTFLITWA